MRGLVNNEHFHSELNYLCRLFPRAESEHLYMTEDGCEATVRQKTQNKNKAILSFQWLRTSLASTTLYVSLFFITQAPSQTPFPPWVLCIVSSSLCLRPYPEFCVTTGISSRCSLLPCCSEQRLFALFSPLTRSPLRCSSTFHRYIYPTACYKLCPSFLPCPILPLATTQIMYASFSPPHHQRSCISPALI